MQEQNNALILSEQQEKLKKAIEKMRVELSMLILEKDHLQLIEYKNLEMQYMLEFGMLEYQTYKLQCKMLRLKRKMELIQMRRNRQEEIDFDAIEDQLEREFEEYQTLLNEKINQMNGAMLRNRAEFLSEQETKELKRLYRIIVKQLHPDFNEDLREAQKELFYKAVFAYETGDLESLQMIAQMLDSQKEPEQENSLQSLQREKEHLEQMIAKVNAQIEQLVSQFPFTVKYLLFDSEQANSYKQQLKELNEYYKQSIVIYKARIKQLLEG